jgi:hypothetical protein
MLFIFLNISRGTRILKINSKNLFIFFILISLIISIFVGIQRFNLEKNFKQVEMVISLNKIRELAIKEGYAEDQLLARLKSKGISSVAVHEDTIETLLPQGKVAFLTTNDLIKINYIQELNIPTSDQISPGELMIVSKDYPLIERIEKVFQQYFGKDMVQKKFLYEKTYGLVVHGNEEEIVKLGLGFSEEDIATIEELGLNVVLRPKNFTKIKPEIFQQKLSTIGGLENISTIIFDEEEVLGYPSKEMLFETAKFLDDHTYPFGVIEFTSQKGIHTIASNVSELAIRVHSITSEEMEKIQLDTAIERWVRAAQERNIRIFYINPFLKTRTVDLIQYNLDYIESIKNNLAQRGYLVGKASLFPNYQIPAIFIYLISLGVISAGIQLLIEFFTIFRKYSVILFIISFAFLVVVDIVLGKIFLLKILALASALIFPTLAIIKNKKFFIKIPPQENNSLTEILKNIFLGISGIMLVSLLGGLIIGALLTHYKFILAIELFSGIKIAYLFPLVLVAVYFWWVKREDKKFLIDDFKKPILFEHALFLFVFSVFGIIYIARSGNFSFLPVPDIEEQMRLLLEKYLIARPRSKEFLIGYPLISLAIAMNQLNLHYFKIPLIIMGTVAPVTIVNTFCHVHTSLSFSILRTFNGYWLGLLIGSLLAFILFIFYRYFREQLNVRNEE